MDYAAQLIQGKNMHSTNNEEAISKFGSWAFLTVKSIVVSCHVKFIILVNTAG